MVLPATKTKAGVETRRAIERTAEAGRDVAGIDELIVILRTAAEVGDVAKSIDALSAICFTETCQTRIRTLQAARLIARGICREDSFEVAVLALTVIGVISEVRTAGPTVSKRSAVETIG